MCLISADVSQGRLPGNLIPTHYDVEIEPNLYAVQPPFFGFRGEVSVAFECVEATRNIILNTDDIFVSVLSLDSVPPGNAPEVVEGEFLSELQFGNLTLSGDLVAGESYVLVMEFSGTMQPQESPEGIWWSSYTREPEDGGGIRYGHKKQLILGI